MRSLKIAIVGLALFFIIQACPPSAFARENKTGNWNFNETTGLINIPSARSIQARTIKFYIRMAKMGEKAPLKNSSGEHPGPSTGKPWDSDWWIDNNGDRGLLWSPYNNLELGLMNIHSYTLEPSVSAKWVCLNEKKYFPAVAIGVQNATGVEEDTNVNNKEVEDANSKAAPFIVASKSFFPDKNLDLTVGYGAGRFRNRVFYGGELFADKKKIWSVVGEFDGNIYSYGIKVRPHKSRWDFGAFMQDLDSPGITINYKLIY